MLAKCANPGCCTQFRYLSEGRMFYVHLPASDSGIETGARQIEHYWLCGTCSQTLRVIGFHGGVAIQSCDRSLQADHPPAVILLRAPQAA